MTTTEVAGRAQNIMSNVQMNADYDQMKKRINELLDERMDWMNKVSAQEEWGNFGMQNHQLANQIEELQREMATMKSKAKETVSQGRTSFSTQNHTFLFLRSALLHSRTTFARIDCSNTRYSFIHR